MGDVTTIGLDIAKSVFQIHGVDVDGAVVIRKRVSRAKVLEFFAAVPRCLARRDPSAAAWPGPSLIACFSPSILR